MGWSDSRKAIGAAGRDDTARAAAMAAQTTANEAKRDAASADTVAKQARGTANSNFDKIANIERKLVGIDNDLEELNAGGDTADWALEENNEQIPEDKLRNAVDQTARTSASNAINVAGRNSTIINALPVFTTITLNPPGIRGRDLRKYMAIEFANKVARENIIQISVETQGQNLTTVNNVTSASLINQINSHGGIMNLVLEDNVITDIANNLSTSDQDIRFSIYYKFEGTSLGTSTPADRIDEVHFGINNDSFIHQPELIGAANFNITARNVFTSGDAAITLPTIGFGLINMGKRASNQAADLSHHIVNFSTIAGLTSSAHAAAATDVATFGFVTANRNYRIGKDNNRRLLVASDGGSTDAIPVTLYRM